MMLRVFLVMGGVVALAAGILLWRVQDHDLDRRQTAPFSVTVEGTRVSGTIWRPDDEVEAVVALVHGDGAQDRTSAGGYAPLINALLDRGIAVASWDKPGVGASGGNWLLQSMADRTVETRAVLHLLEARLKGTAIGALGFSQAGWVLPALTPEDADFLVLVGAAVSWQDQGDYFTAVRLRAEGGEQQQIATTLDEQAAEDERIFGSAATVSDAPEGLSPDRWAFIRRNRHADARQALSAPGPPLLAIWGAEDLNVDPERNAEIFEDVLRDHGTPHRITILPDATHGLLRAPAYNWQLTEDWSLTAVARFVVEGRHAYAPGALREILDWIEVHSGTSQSLSADR